MTARSAARGGIWFLAAVLTLYGFAYMLDPVSTGYAMDRSLALAGRLLPVLGIVVLVLFFSNLLLQREWVRENLGVHSGPRGWFLAAVGGILAAGPVYPWYALLGGLRSKGMRTGLMVVFLYTRAVKLPLSRNARSIGREASSGISNSRLSISPPPVPKIGIFPSRFAWA